MEVFLILIGMVLMLGGACSFLVVLYKYGLSVYYRIWASEKQIDKGYEKYVLKKSREYRDFEKEIDELVK